MKNKSQNKKDKVRDQICFLKLQAKLILYPNFGKLKLIIKIQINLFQEKKVYKINKMIKIM
jgi:hypothetical protein